MPIPAVCSLLWAWLHASHEGERAAARALGVSVSVYKRALMPLATRLRVAHFTRRTLDKSRGQNFLLHSDQTEAIARAALGGEDRPIVEIGSGPGGLTRALFVAGARSVVAIEPDLRFHPLLQELREALCEGRVLRILSVDGRGIDVASLCSNAERKPIVVGNLPYSVASVILQNLLCNVQDWHSLCFLFQREVAERIAAPAASKRYGRLSVLAQVQTRVFAAKDFPPQVFFPAPKVFSRLLRFLPHAEIVCAEDYETLKLLTARLFTHRRKKMKTTLRSLGATGEAFLAAAERTRIDLQDRPEQLPPRTWLEWARELRKHSGVQGGQPPAGVEGRSPPQARKRC